MKFILLRLIYIIVAITILILTSSLCMDGWVTSSTGRGTCSHHGGQMWGIIFPLFLFGYFIFSFFLDQIENKAFEVEKKLHKTNKDCIKSNDLPIANVTAEQLKKNNNINNSIIKNNNISQKTENNINIKKKDSIASDKPKVEINNYLKNEIIRCPICRSRMVLRVARRGINAGKKFYGCSKYPKCNGTKNFKNNIKCPIQP